MNDQRTLRDLQTICDGGRLGEILSAAMLRRLAVLSDLSLRAAKWMVRARFGKDCAPQILSRVIKEERERLRRAERATWAKSADPIADNHPRRKLPPGKRDALMSAFGRRGGAVCCRKGLAAMTPEKAAAVRAAALVGRQRARVEREAAGILGRRKPREPKTVEAEQPAVPIAAVVVIGAPAREGFVMPRDG